MPMISYGSVWMLAVAHLFATNPNPEGMLYLDNDGTLLLTDTDGEAPAQAHYVVTLHPGADPVKIAARLAYVARSKG